MATKKKTPPPIDRPLSKAYLRQFSGWSTAYPPGQSEPNSLREMENLWIDRNGAASVRPGMRYLTYTDVPDLDPVVPGDLGSALNLEIVGAPELFYTNEGSRALLFAVREANGKVGFRAVLFTGVQHVVRRLTDPEVGFSIPQGESVLNFEADTGFIKYLQINNRILALSDNAEPARLFFVGGQKAAKKLDPVTVPHWRVGDKLTLLHPEKAWVDGRVTTERQNLAINPSFEIGTIGWSVTGGELTIVDDPDRPGFQLEVTATPERTNMVLAPLHDVASTGTAGWTADEDSTLVAAGPYLQLGTTEPGDYFAAGGRIITDVESEGKYRIGADISVDLDTEALLKLDSYGVNGAMLGSVTVPVEKEGRTSTVAITASKGATTLRLSLGIRSAAGGSARFRNLVVCRDGQSTEMFHGGSGTYYSWSGTTNQSASTYQPPVDVKLRSAVVPLSRSNPSYGAAYLRTMDLATAYQVGMLIWPNDKTIDEADYHSTSGTSDPSEDWHREGGGRTGGSYEDVNTCFQLVLEQMEQGQRVRVDDVLLSPEPYPPGGDYFDGSTPPTVDKTYRWEGLPHESIAEELTYADASVWLTPETPTAGETNKPLTGTLVAAGGADANEYKVAVYYTFENHTGESAPSMITELRVRRGWANWIWETANAAGEPSGNDTDDPYLACDQLVARMPREVYDQAVAEGALRWNLYAFAWSDQEPVPTVATLAGSKDIFPDDKLYDSQPLPYETGCWIRITPQRRAPMYDMLLPTEDNRINSSLPPKHRNGVVAGDRLILVGDPDAGATISWSSSQAGLYTNFTVNRGGGQKTLTSGNLNLPYAVKLWQNPQSVDTLTILCSDDNGRSNSYYMAPSNIQGQTTGLTGVMGFEETTSTPGTVAPYGAEVLNNALYRPLDRSLTKSTANNYNINHKSMSDTISNMWWLLESKQWMMSAQLDNRLFYLVHNPEGELLLPGCKGNEIWIYDIASEKGHWSRFLIQGAALKPFTVGTRTYMGISRPDGIFYLDGEHYVDDYVGTDGEVHQRPVPWKLVTNTQGANRAHDAWAHLQQVGIIAGNFRGSMRYGVRGLDVNGRRVDRSKVFTDNGDPAPRGQTWDVQDALLIRREMMEWFFYAESLTGVQGTGKLGVVQYRYTPVSVNVGYEYGSIETFEYGADAGGDGSDYSRNGIPLPYVDYERP